MQTFLHKVALELVQKHPDNLGEIAVILPNRRSQLFFIEELSKVIQQVAWTPKIISLEDFIQEFSQLEKLDSVDLLIELYEIHKEIEGQDTEPLEEFIDWGNILIQDFNEIDRYLVDAIDLYSFLTEAKAIESWNIDGEALSPFQLRYLSFWRKLAKYYSLFKERLLHQKYAYQGLLFREVAENLNASIKIENQSHYYFIGFNALTPSEEKFVQFFKDSKKASFLWDADAYLLQETQEAGRFLRKHKKHHSPFNWEFENFKNGEKSIKIIGVSGAIGQAKLIGNLIQKNQTKSQEKSAIVLADEALLMPVLDAMPLEIEALNVTMGYPLSFSSFYSFFDKIILTQQILSKDVSKGIYYKDAINLLNHPIWKIFHSDIAAKIEGLIREIRAQNKIEIDANYLTQLNAILNIQLLDKSISGLEQFNDSLLQLIDLYIHDVKSNQQSFQTEVILKFKSHFNRLKEIFVKFPDIEISSFLQLFRKLISSSTTSFIGEPLTGMQLMGVLETRTLDFDHLIIAGLNEGVLPSAKSYNSFIPYDIKRKYEMPSYKEKEAIFAYHFYRLISRAKKIELIYNTQFGKLGGGEKSRFIQQLQNELPPYNSKIKIEESTISQSPLIKVNTEIQIITNDVIQDIITNRLAKGLSPSAINTYLNCPLDYYYKYVVGLREQEDEISILDSKVFGDILHFGLEKIYLPFVGQLLSIQKLEAQKINIDTLLLDSFKAKSSVIPSHGKALLIYEVAKKYIKKLINYDIQTLKENHRIELIALEKPLSKEILFKGKKVQLKGFADRIDRFNGEIRIIDYKTGKYEQRELNLIKSPDLLEGKKPKAIQLLIYLYLLMEEYPNQKIHSGIIGFRNHPLRYDALQCNQENALAEEFIAVVLERISNKNQIFQHNSSSQFCKFC